MATGKSNTAIAESLVLTKRAVEKHINSIFMKLGMAGDNDVSKRVKATLMFLAEQQESESGTGGIDVTDIASTTPAGRATRDLPIASLRRSTRP